jgi:hypothetical protein
MLAPIQLVFESSFLTFFTNLAISQITEVLDLKLNQFVAPLPDWMESFTNLRLLYLNNNSFSGDIPNIFGDMMQLEDFLFYGNPNLEGTIPPSLCQTSDSLVTPLEDQVTVTSLPNVICTCCEGYVAPPTIDEGGGAPSTANNMGTPPLIGEAGSGGQQPQEGEITDTQPETENVPSITLTPPQAPAQASFDNVIEIDASNANEVWFGQEVALSDDGSRVAVLIGGAVGAGGVVRVYEKSSTYSSTEWVPLGGDMEAETTSSSATGQPQEHSMAFSHDGKTVALSRFTFPPPVTTSEGSGAISLVGRGEVYVYTYSNGDWMLVGGQPITVSSSPTFGKSISFSYNARTIAIGAPGPPAAAAAGDASILAPPQGGSVHVMTLASSTALNDPTTTWVPLGDPITSSNASFGEAVALSALGDYVAISATGYGLEAGLVVISHFEEEWTLLGMVTPAAESGTSSNTTTSSMFGHSLAISGNSQSTDHGAPLCLVVGEPMFNESAGRATLFTYNEQDDMFVQDKILVKGYEPNEQVGYSVSVSLDGNLIAIGAPGRLMTGTIERMGSVRLLKKNTDTVGDGNIDWMQELIVQIPDDEDGENTIASSELAGTRPKTSFGYSVSVADTGVGLAVSAPSMKETDLGQVLLYL